MPLTRRFFFATALIPAGGFGSVPSLRRLGFKSPNEKLNIASIGSGGKAYGDIQACKSENIVALCDVDDERGSRSFKLFPRARTYRDYRRMLDAQGSEIDAVIVATPDHTHAPASIFAMERGKHVYCQKPLARTVWEVRKMAEVAARHGVATQMGNQGYSNEGARQCCEIIWSGELGQITEVHAWSDRPIWPQGTDVAVKPGTVPSTLGWDLWLGTAADRPYSPAYVPRAWRGFYDFGCGALGDMACHILGAPNMALRLDAPVSVECVHQEGAAPNVFPRKSVVRYDFAARGAMGPVQIFWYDGLKAQPEIHGIPPGGAYGDGGSNSALFIGAKGAMAVGCYGDSARLLPADRYADYVTPAPFLTRSPGHYQDWLRACKGGDPACSNFSIAAPFTEWMLLGVIALRVPGKLQWDAARGRFANSPEANQLLKPHMRRGWQIK